MRKLLLVLCLALLPSVAWAQATACNTSGSGTTLANAAANLATKAWCQLTVSVSGISANFLNSETETSSDYISQFANGFAWDPINKKARFIGQTHGGSYQGWHRVYTDSDNTWRNDTWPTGLCQSGTPSSPCATHAYDHQDIDPRTGDYYYISYNSNTVRRYRSGSWSALTTVPWDANVNTYVMRWFPEMSSVASGSSSGPGALLVLNPDWGLWKGVPGTGTTVTWTCLADTGVSTSTCPGAVQMAPFNAGTQISGAYSRTKRVVVFCQSTTCYKVDSAGTITALTAPPVSASMQSSMFGVDPVSGNFLLHSSSTLYQLDPTGSGTWTTVVTTVPANIHAGSGTSGDGSIIAPISTYGVNMVLTYTSSATFVYLYKHTTTTSADLDYIRRTEATGVKRWFSWDESADFTTCAGGTQGCFGGNFGIIPPSGTSDYTKATQDTSVAASGGGSLKFTIASNTGSDMAGSWHTNVGFTNGTQQFTSGETVYIQWRQRFSPCLLKTGANDAACLASSTVRSYSGGGGWKQSIWNAGDPATCTTSATGTCATSCLSPEVVTQNTLHRGAVQMYHSCTGGDGAAAFAPFEEPFGGSDFKFQNGYSGFCPYSEISVGNLTNCIIYHPNEWMTFKLRITLGTFDGNSYPDSTVEQWVAREGAVSTKTQAYITGVNAKNLIDTEPTNYGKIWLLPYNTGKSSGESHPEAYTWYDELIISTSDIADPGFPSSSDTTAPDAPTGFRFGP